MLAGGITFYNTSYGAGSISDKILLTGAWSGAEFTFWYFRNTYSFNATPFRQLFVTVWSNLVYSSGATTASIVIYVRKASDRKVLKYFSFSSVHLSDYTGYFDLSDVNEQIFLEFTFRSDRGRQGDIFVRQIGLNT